MAKKEQFFFKGLNKDATPLLQPENTYTDNTGFRLTSNGNNSYSLESARGNIVSFVLNPGYQPIGWAWVENHIAILSTNSVGGVVSNGEIGIATFTPLSIYPAGGYVPLYNHKLLNLSSYHQAEAIIYTENKLTEGFYWTDFFNPPRTLNIANPIFTTYFASGTLVIGNQYMVVKGSVNHNGINYGPNEVAGTVFTAVNINYVDNNIPGFPARVIAYFNVTNIDIVPIKSIGNLFFSRWLTGGGLLSGSYQYTYRLVTSDNTFTNWSYLTDPVDVSGAFTPGNTAGYQAYQGANSTAGTTNSTKGNELIIKIVDTNYNKIQVAYVRSIGLHAPLPPVIFFNGTITGSTMTIAHMGGDDLQPLTFADLQLAFVGIRKAKTLRTQKNKLFFGNIEQGLPFTFDPSTATVAPFDYLVPSDVTGYQTDPAGVQEPSFTMGLNGHMNSFDPTPIGKILTDSWYIVKGVGGDSITYNTVVYTPGQTFQGVINKRDYSAVVGTATVRACIRVQKYTGVYEIHEMSSDWYDQKGMTNDFYIRGYWRGATVRTGVMLWDKLGNPTFVRWMKDVVVPKQYQTVAGVNYRLMERYTPDTYTAAGYFGGAGGAVDSVVGTSLRQIGLKVSGLNLKQIADSIGLTVAQLSNEFSGFSIVRAPMETNIMGQGILYPTGKEGSTPTYHPSGTNNLANDNWSNRGLNTYCFYSPDFQFHYNSLPNTAPNDYLEIQDYYDDPLHATDMRGTLDTNNYHFYSKYYQQQYGPNGTGAAGAGAAPLNLQNTLYLLGCREVAFGSLSVLLQNGTTFQNNAQSATGPFDLTNIRNAVGALTHVVTTTTVEGIAPIANGYGNFQQASSVRSLVNWCRQKSNFYGGSSDDAKANSKYVYAGHFQSFNDTAFMTYLTGNAGIVDNIEVWGGDCFVTIYDIARMVKDGSSDYQYSVGTLFPVESGANTFLRQGRHFSRNRSYEPAGPINVDGVSFNPLQPENFIYNDAYSHQEENIFFPALPVGFLNNTTFNHRVIYSETKIDGEKINNFRQFLLNSFRDLEGSNGPINNLRRKEGRLFCWQDRGVSYLPVQERITMGSPLGQQTVLGVGGVLDRYDEIKNFYGNQHQWSLCESEDGFFWFDFRRKAFMYMVGDMTELQIVKGLHSYFQNAFAFGQVTFDNPVDQGGITGIYDGRFKEALMVFQSPVQDDIGTKTHLTIGFDTINKQFSVLNYPFRTGMLIDFKDRIFSGWATRWSAINGSTPYNIGDELNDGNSNYVCILAYTTTTVAVIPSLDPTHWAKTNSINEVYLHNEGDYGQFYGVVYDYLVSFIINVDKDFPKYVDLMQKLQNITSWTEEKYENSFQVAIDSNLDTIASKDYKYRDRSWYSSIPKSSDRSRLIDHYVKVTLRKVNSLNGSPITSKNELIQLIGVIFDYHRAF